MRNRDIPLTIAGYLHDLSVGIQREQVDGTFNEPVDVRSLIDLPQRMLGDAVTGQHMPFGKPLAGRSVELEEVIGERRRVIVVREWRIIDGEEVGPARDPRYPPGEFPIRPGDQIEEYLGARLAAAYDRNPLAA